MISVLNSSQESYRMPSDMAVARNAARFTSPCSIPIPSPCPAKKAFWGGRSSLTMSKAVSKSSNAYAVLGEDTVPPPADLETSTRRLISSSRPTRYSRNPLNDWLGEFVGLSVAGEWVGGGVGRLVGSPVGKLVGRTVGERESRSGVSRVGL